jgi:hypothetical protein
MLNNQLEQRDALLTIACGRQKVGKTYRTMQELIKYVMDDPRVGRKGRKVLIFDTNGEYPNIPSIDFDISKAYEKNVDEKDIVRHITAWNRIEIRRIIPFRKDGNPMDIADKQKTGELLLKHFRGGLLLFEDMLSWSLGAKSIALIGNITSKRHRSQDIVIHLQSMNRIDPVLFENVDIVRMHQDEGRLDLIEKKVNNVECLKVAIKCVELGSLTNKYYFQYWHYKTSKISGSNLTKKLMYDACIEAAKGDKNILRRYMPISASLKNEKAVNDACVKFANMAISKYYGNEK